MQEESVTAKQSQPSHEPAPSKRMHLRSRALMPHCRSLSCTEQTVMSKRNEPGGSPQKQTQQPQPQSLYLSSISSLVQSPPRATAAAAASSSSAAASNAALVTPPPKKRRMDATDATPSPPAAAAAGSQRGAGVRGISFDLPPLVDPTVIAARLREEESPVSPTVAANFVRRSSRAKRPPSPVVAAHAGESSSSTLYMDSPHRTAGGVMGTSLPLERQMALTQHELQNAYPAVSSTVRLQLNRDPAKGLCVSALSYIPKDSFVLEYAGDLLTNAESEEVEEAYYREHTLDTVGCYMFWFKFKRKIYCIDSTAPGPGEKPGTTLEQHLKPYLPPLSPMGMQRSNSNQSLGSRSNSRNGSPTKHNGTSTAAAAPMSPPPARSNASPSPAPASPAPAVAASSSWASAASAAAAVAAVIASPRSFSPSKPAASSSVVAPTPVLASVVPASSVAPGSMSAPPAPRSFAATPARSSSSVSSPPPPPRLESLGYGYARYINHSRVPNLMVRVLDCPSDKIRTNRFNGAADPNEEERKQHIRRNENQAKGKQQGDMMGEQEESKDGSGPSTSAAAAASAVRPDGTVLSSVPLNLFKTYPRLCFFAARAISGGEELTIDYGDRDQDSIEQHPWLKG